MNIWPVDGQLGCFQFWAIKSKVAINIWAQEKKIKGHRISFQFIKYKGNSVLSPKYDYINMGVNILYKWLGEILKFQVMKQNVAIYYWKCVDRLGSKID